MRIIVHNHQQYEIYSIGEAPEGINPVPWRETTPDTEYVVSDDKLVVPIIGRSELGQFKTYKTPIGVFTIPPVKKLLRKTYDYQEKHNAFWKGEREGKLTTKKKLFVFWYLRTGDKIDAYRRAFPGVSSRYIETYANRLLVQREVIEYMESQYKDVLTELGIDEKWVFENLKRIIEDQVEPGSTKVSALKELMDILGMKRKRVTEKVGMLLDSDTIQELDSQKQRELQEAEEIEALPSSQQDVKETNN